MCAVKAIEFKKVSFSYEGFDDKVLTDVDFSVEYGEVALLSGLSGEGKSTLISIASGIIPNIVKGKIKGEALIDGSSIEGRKLAAVSREDRQGLHDHENRQNLAHAHIVGRAETAAYNGFRACDGTENSHTRRAARQSRRRERKAFNGLLATTCKGRVCGFGGGTQARYGVAVRRFGMEYSGGQCDESRE